MLLLTILLIVETTKAANRAYLKFGVLSAHMGWAYLVEDVLWVKYPFPSLVDMLDKLRVITAQLNKTLWHLEKDILDETSHQVFNLLYARVTYVNGTIILALENCGGLKLFYLQKTETYRWPRTTFSHVVWNRNERVCRGT